MAWVVLLRGVNVGGHKTFRPTVVAERLKRYHVINVGAAGTFVVRNPPSQSALRDELRRALPFETEIILCRGTEVLQWASDPPFRDHPARPEIIPFVSVLAKRSRAAPSIPADFPEYGRWMMRLLGIRGRFVFGVYRREMKAIRYLGVLDELFGTVATTRNWNTIQTILDVLNTDSARTP